ncbi:hypothetical protein [Nocardioides litoris]|uniref:hypothetical protein n=1 Tax=Nocardioides litoris TaxID=1926648 RepID=UPI001121BCDB|nr:hypothetical protein [Nocardioides litoris]
MRKKVAAGVVGILAVAGVGAGTWVAVADDDGTTARGACGGAAYELTVEEDDGGLELSYELQSSGPGEVWTVEVTQGDATVLEGERTTDEDGELDLDAPVDEGGATAFRVTATPEQGEPCVASATR